MSDDFDLDAIIRPQLEGEQIIFDLLRDAGIQPEPARFLVRGIIQRLASHNPPILLCFPDQIKDES